MVSSAVSLDSNVFSDAASDVSRDADSEMLPDAVSLDVSEVFSDADVAESELLDAELTLALGILDTSESDTLAVVTRLEPHPENPARAQNVAPSTRVERKRKR